MVNKTISDTDINNPASIPVMEAGIGLRSDHYEDLIQQKPDIGWIEVHPENYFGGGLPRHYLIKARELYPLSLHAVGLSLGSDQDVARTHLTQIKELINIYEPFQVSDHASWSATGNAHLNDLLPLPYTYETMERLCKNIDQTQNFLGRQILVENPSTYIAYQKNDMSEAEFMNNIAARTGCGILLDINNIYVQSRNHDFDPYTYLDDIDIAPVKEMHLAGHIEQAVDSRTLLIDTHNQHVCEDVWNLYAHAIARFGKINTLIEWDADLPALSVLCTEAEKAQNMIDKSAQEKYHAAE